jgi:hypothetical protein
MWGNSIDIRYRLNKYRASLNGGTSWREKSFGRPRLRPLRHLDLDRKADVPAARLDASGLENKPLMNAMQRSV